MLNLLNSLIYGIGCVGLAFMGVVILIFLLSWANDIRDARKYYRDHTK